MSNKLTLLLCLSVLFQACNSKQEQKIDTEYFSSSQLSELNQILQKFDSTLIKWTNKKTVPEAYLAYSDIMSKGAFIPRYNTFYNSIDHLMKLKVFNEIWFSYDSTIDITLDNIVLTPEEIIESKRSPIRLSYDHRKSFFKLVKKLGNNNVFIKDYYDNIINEKADCGPVCMLTFSNSLSEFDLNNDNHRLLIAVHYITLSLR